MEAPSTIKGTRSVQPDLTQQRKHSTEWEACGRGRIRRHVRPPTNTGRHLQPAPRRYLGRGFGRGLWCPIREQMIIGSERFSKRYQSPSRLVWVASASHLFQADRSRELSIPLSSVHSAFVLAKPRNNFSFISRKAKGRPSCTASGACPGPIQARSLDESSLSEMRNSGCKGFGEDPFVPYRRS